MDMTEPNINDLILQKLEEYGDSVIGGKLKKKNKHIKNVTKTKHSEDQESSLNPPPLSERQKKKRRKKQKKADSATETLEEEVDYDDVKELSGHERRLREMSQQLGLTEFKLEMERQKKVQEEKEQKKKQKQPELVVFTSYKSKKHKKPDSVDVNMTTQSQAPDFDMRQARFDVQKFGIKGFQGNQKQEAMTALLIKLGAKPPKKKYVNYKELQEVRKQEMLEEKQKREMDRKLGFKVPKANKGKKRPRDKNDVGVIDGQVGMWKSGVQIVSKDDLKGFKKKKLK